MIILNGLESLSISFPGYSIMMDSFAWGEDLTCFSNSLCLLFVLPLFPWKVEVNTDLSAAVRDNDRMARIQDCTCLIVCS